MSVAAFINVFGLIVKLFLANLIVLPLASQDSSVNKMAGYRLNGQGLIPSRGRDNSSPQYPYRSQFTDCI
jgi:hypothetical protein